MSIAREKQLKNKDYIAVVDFGSQYNLLIARRIRELQVYCEIYPCDYDLEKLKKLRPKGIILSGGPDSVYDKDSPRIDPGIFNLGIPILGICYGMQFMAAQLGGEVQKLDKGEYGKVELRVVESGPLFQGLNPQLICWMSHRDSVTLAPEGFSRIAESLTCPVAAMADEKRGLYGVQFHPEVAHTPWGVDLLENFLQVICKCRKQWTMASYRSEAVEDIRRRVGEKRVLCALSGGVDSSAVAALIHQAIGEQLTCVFVDHGFMRKGEARQVVQTFRNHFKVNLVHVNAKKRFLDKLKGVVDPEQKRKIIGVEFIRLFEEEAKKLGDFDFLAQGTLYPDVIESAGHHTGKAAVIKSHHNVGGLPDDMKFKLIEPLRLLFKDEVRALCGELGMPREITWRQPFPGPGLAIRIIGEVTDERLKILQHADSIVMEEVKNAGLSYEIWQSFAVLPAIKSVGVKGDQRSYAYPIILRAVSSADGMTADWARLPFDLLEKISNRICNEVEGVNRLAYDISSKPPSTIEWE